MHRKQNDAATVCRCRIVTDERAGTWTRGRWHRQDPVRTTATERRPQCGSDALVARTDARSWRTRTRAPLTGAAVAHARVVLARRTNGRYSESVERLPGRCRPGRAARSAMVWRRSCSRSTTRKPWHPINQGELAGRRKALVDAIEPRRSPPQADGPRACFSTTQPRPRQQLGRCRPAMRVTRIARSCWRGRAVSRPPRSTHFHCATWPRARAGTGDPQGPRPGSGRREPVAPV